MYNFLFILDIEKHTLCRGAKYCQSLLTWSYETKGDHIFYDGSSIKHSLEIGEKDDLDSEHVCSMIFTTSPIPMNTHRYYFEVSIKDEGESKQIAIGMTNASPEYRNFHFPGCNSGTIGYHGNGKIYNGREESLFKEEGFGTGDTIGCMYIHEKDEDGSLFICHFTRNGKYIKTMQTLQKGRYYPSVAIASPGAEVTTNMGEKKFLYNLPGK